MKYIISENRMNDLMQKYFDKNFNPNDMDYYYVSYEEDEEGNEIETEDAMAFYKKSNNPDVDVIFRYYFCEYFSEDAHVMKQVCPILSFENDHTDTLNGFFGDMWKEFAKKWVQDNFNLSPKTVE
jgi:hypothetical protein